MNNLIGVSGKIGSGKDTVGKIIQYLTSNVRDDFDCQGLYWADSRYQIKKFAAKLKQIVSVLTGYSLEELEKQEVKDTVLGKEWWYYSFFDGPGRRPTRINNKKEAELLCEEAWGTVHSAYLKLVKPTVRQMLQEVGTDAMRNIIHPNVWVNSLFSDYIPETTWDSSKWNKKISNWIITDMRFPNELLAIKERGGINIRVNRFDKTQDSLVKSRSGKYLNPEGPTNNHYSETALDDARFDYTINNNGTIEELIEQVKEILLKENVI